MQSKKARGFRVPRNIHKSVREDENQHLWAVSYSDFLMVILSFFIIFYSPDEQTRATILNRISQQFSKDSAPADGEANFGSQRLPTSLSAAFPDLKIEKEDTQDVLYIHFPENFFKAGQFELSKEQEQAVEAVLLTLKNSSDKIQINFEGYTDPEPIKYTQRRYTFIKSNYQLSSLRANSALEIARKIGFNESHLLASAFSSNKRSSRSLTLKITHKEL